MILVLGGDPPVRLDEPDDLRRLHAVVLGAAGPPGPTGLADLVAGVEGLAVAGDGFAVTPALLQRLAGPLGEQPQWRDGLAAAVRYARDRGWWDDARGAVLVHVERAGPDA